MSVINQVLNDLEKRGAMALPGESAIRPVHAGSRWRLLWVLLGALALVFAGVILWDPDQIARVIPESMDPAVTTELRMSPEIAQVIMPMELPAQEAASGQPPGDDLSAMRLSYELSRLPLERAEEPDIPAKQAPAPRQAPNHATAKKVQSADKPAQPAGSVDKQMKRVSPHQQAESEFRRASVLLQEGRSNQAFAGYEAALKLDTGHEGARQAMAALLLENKRNGEAEQLLAAGLEINPRNTAFAMLLARLQVERSELPLAMATLQKALPYADRQADYHAFVAAIYQRQSRHKEAIMHYQIAVGMVPNSGVWLMGLGISLQAAGANEAARDVYRRAIESHTLSEDLQSFVMQQMKAQ